MLAQYLMLATVFFLGALIVLHAVSSSKSGSADMLGFYANLLADVRRNRIAQMQADRDGHIETLPHPDNDAPSAAQSNDPPSPNAQPH